MLPVPGIVGVVTSVPIKRGFTDAGLTDAPVPRVNPVGNAPLLSTVAVVIPPKMEFTSAKRRAFDASANLFAGLMATKTTANKIAIMPMTTKS